MTGRARTGRRARRTPAASPAAPEQQAPSASETRAGRWAWMVAAALLVATWLLFVSDRAPGTGAALSDFPLDDAWIHMVYARALATEGGFHYNAGVPETGMTSPLWVVVLAMVHRTPLGQHPEAMVIAAKVLGLLCSVATLITLIALARALRLGGWGVAMAALLFALDPALTFGRASGMEGPLFTLLVLLSLWLAVRQRPLVAGATLGLAIVTRPEGLVLLPVLLALLLRRDTLRRPESATRLALSVLLALAPALLWMAYCLYATGAPLPNTFYAKLAAAGSRFPQRLALGWTDYVHDDLPYFRLEIGTLLALLGAWTMLRRAPRAAAGVLAAGLLLFGGTLYSREFARGHFHYWERWLIPSFPVLLLAIAAGWAELVRWASARDHPLPRAARAVPAVAAALLLASPIPARLMERADVYAWNCQNIRDLDVRAGRWIHDHVSYDSVVATSDAGAVRYFGDRPTVDLSGLNDHRIRAALARNQGAQLLDQLRVGWFTIFPFWVPELVARLPLQRVREFDAPHYTICEAPQDTLVVYRWRR